MYNNMFMKRARRRGGVKFMGTKITICFLSFCLYMLEYCVYIYIDVSCGLGLKQGSSTTYILQKRLLESPLGGSICARAMQINTAHQATRSVVVVVVSCMYICVCVKDSFSFIVTVRRRFPTDYLKFQSMYLALGWGIFKLLHHLLTMFTAFV